MSPPPVRTRRPAVLVLCTGNSCRSQMAEGLLRAAAGDLIEIHSAGVEPAKAVHPRAVAVMAEIGIDISGQRPKHLDQFLQCSIHVVVTLCDHAAEVCPVFPGQGIQRHWGFRDPARISGDEAAVTREFRAVRDEMKRMIDAYAAGLRDSVGGISDGLQASP